MNKQLSDFYNIHDQKIRGVVKLFKDGEFLFEKENMIMNEGRKAISNIFFSQIFGQAQTAKDSLYRFAGLALGTGNARTVPEMTVNDFNFVNGGGSGSTRYTTFDSAIKLNTVKETDLPFPSNVTVNYDSRTISFKVDITGDANYPENIRELGFFLYRYTVSETGNVEKFLISENDDTISRSDDKIWQQGLTLFSRIVFDAVPIGSGSRFSIDYTIYF